MEKALVNRFIIFYTMKCVWKLKQDSISTMYEALDTNRSMFDNVIALKNVEVYEKAKHFQKLTDIDVDYWEGIKQLVIPDIPYTEWVEYIRLRKNKNPNDSTQLSATRQNIESKIKTASEKELSQMSGAFVKLLFFAENKRKRSTLDVENNIQAICRMMRANQWRELAKLDKDSLDAYRVALREQYELVSAVSVIMSQERG